MYSHLIANIQLLLAVGGQVERIVVHDFGIVVPLDVGYFGMLGQQVIGDAEHVVLYLGVREVEHYLCAAASLGERTVFVLQNPFRMVFEEFALGVGHFGFNPDTELHAMFFGRGY